MRILVPLVFIAAVLTLTWQAIAAPANLVGDADTARPGGVYTSFTTPDAGACAQACSRDGICMAWTYQGAAQACELKAVVTPAVAARGAWSGLSSRAPDFARALAQTPAPVMATPQSAPSVQASAAADLHGASDELLGGPDDESMPLQPRRRQ